MSIAETARLYRVTPHAIRLANRKYNLGFDTRERPRDRDMEEMRSRVEALAAEGMSQTQISNELKVPRCTIKRWCRAWGIKLATARPWANGRWMDRLCPHMTPAQVEDVEFLRGKKKFSFREALVTVGRADLLEMLG